MIRRVAFAAATILLLAGLGTLWLYCIPISTSTQIDTKAIASWGGHAYVAPMANRYLGAPKWILGAPSDTNQWPRSSNLRLLEDGKAIGPPHSTHADIASLGQGRYSHWADSLVFSASDNTDPAKNGRRYLARQMVSSPPELPFVLLLAGLGGLRLLCRDSTFRIAAWMPAAAFWAGFAALAASLNIAFRSLLPWPVPWPDSVGYVNWWLIRTVGYPMLLHAQEAALSTWEYLPLVQLNLLLAGVAALAVGIVRITGSYTLAWILVATVHSAAAMLLSAADLLTESAFSALVMLHVAFMGLLFAGGSRVLAALAGVSLAAAVLVKSIGLVLVGPVLLLLAFAGPLRRNVAALVLVPALVAWIGPSAYNLARNGFFEGSIASGYAMGGHVAWAIKQRLTSALPEEAALVERRIAPVLAQRPARFSDLNAYIEHTANEYNTLLWRNMVPELSARLPACRDDSIESRWENCTWSQCAHPCKRELNRLMLTLSREAIAAEPARFALHVAAHDFGMWRNVFTSGDDLLRGLDRRAERLSAAYAPGGYDFSTLLGTPAVQMSPGERAELVSQLEAAPLNRLVNLVTWPSLVRRYVLDPINFAGAAVLVVGIMASVLVFRFAVLSPELRWACYIGLCLHAYFLGHALAQPMLVRYAWTMQGLVPVMLLLAAHSAWSLWNRRKRT